MTDCRFEEKPENRPKSVRLPTADSGQD